MANIVVEATGAAINQANSKFGVLPGVAGGYFSTPSATVNQLASDVDIQVLAAPDSWTPSAGAYTLAAKRNGTTAEFTFQINQTTGLLQLYWYGSGAAYTSAISSVAPTVSAGNKLWLRVYRNYATLTCKFYTSQDGITWIQLGSDAGFAAYTPATTSVAVTIGADASGTSPFNGRIYAARIYTTNGGTLVTNFNANDFSSGSTWTASTTGETWTINGNVKVFGGSGSSSIPAPWDANGPQGYLSEGAGTQILATADIRDMTTGNWTLGATMTRARTSTGIDGVASTATRLTGGAVAATNIITTTITAAATSRTYSAYVKRVTGTGIVRISQDNFATNTDITSQLVNGSWVLIQLNQTQLNAVMGFKIDTSTDAIDVDTNQFETGAVASSRMLATGAARNADVDSYVTSGNIPASGAFVIAGEFTSNVTGIDIYRFMLSCGTDANNAIDVAGFTDGTFRFTRAVASVVTQASIAHSPVAGTTYKWSARYSTVTGLDVWVNGTKGANSAGTTQPIFGTSIFYGVRLDSALHPYAAQSKLQIFGRDLSDAQCAALSS